MCSDKRRKRKGEPQCFKGFGWHQEDHVVTKVFRCRPSQVKDPRRDQMCRSNAECPYQQVVTLLGLSIALSVRRQVLREIFFALSFCVLEAWCTVGEGTVCTRFQFLVRISRPGYSSSQFLRVDEATRAVWEE